jgi:curved DNA-binding protein CbpA
MASSGRIRTEGKIAMDGATAFALLGIDESAQPADITRAFRRAAKRCHPDHGGDRTEFEVLYAAYEFLRALPPKRRPNPFLTFAGTAPTARFDAYDSHPAPRRRRSFADELDAALRAA